MLDDRLPGEHPNRGWNRASIMFWSRRAYRPRIRPEDRRPPTGMGPVRILATSALAAICATVALVWPPLFYISISLHLSGRVYGGVLAVATLALTFAFFAWIAFETRRDRDAASRL